MMSPGLGRLNTTGGTFRMDWPEDDVLVVGHVVVPDLLHLEVAVDLRCAGSREGTQRANQAHPPATTHQRLFNGASFSHKRVPFLQPQPTNTAHVTVFSLNLNLTTTGRVKTPHLYTAHVSLPKLCLPLFRSVWRIKYHSYNMMVYFFTTSLVPVQIHVHSACFFLP